MPRYVEPSILGWIVDEQDESSSLTYRRVEDLVIQTQFQESAAPQTAVGEYEPAPNRPLGKFSTVGAAIELVGNTANSDPAPPPWGPWLRARGFSETETGSTTKSFTYTLADPHLDSTHSDGGRTGNCDILSWIHNLDGHATTIDNSVAESITFEFVAGEIPLIRGLFRGQITASSTAPTDTTLPTLTAEPYNPPFWGGASVSVNPNAAGAITSLICSRIMLTVNGGLSVRKSATATNGFGQPILDQQITEYIMEIEKPDLSTWNVPGAFENEHEIAVTFNYDGGSTSGTDGQGMTVSFDMKLTQRPEEFEGPNRITMLRLVGKQSQDASNTKLNIAIAST